MSLADIGLKAPGRRSSVPAASRARNAARVAPGPAVTPGLAARAPGPRAGPGGAAAASRAMAIRSVYIAVRFPTDPSVGRAGWRWPRAPPGPPGRGPRTAAAPPARPARGARGSARGEVEDGPPGGLPGLQVGARLVDLVDRVPGGDEGVEVELAGLVPAHEQREVLVRDARPAQA